MCTTYKIQKTRIFHTFGVKHRLFQKICLKYKKYREKNSSVSCTFNSRVMLSTHCFVFNS